MVDGRHGESGTNVRKQLDNRMMISLRQTHVFAEPDLAIIQVQKMVVPCVKV